MVEADGVKRWAAPNQLKATLAIAWRTAGEDGVNRRAVPRQLPKEARHTAWRMVEEDAVKRRAVPSQL